MGVPKFFRYISERYPCLSEFVKEYQIPTFDNLYLDMNGIIHMCSHPDNNNPHFRITEEKIFSDIFHYIEVLFSMIKPEKVFFMAVDGVAPRAKMNQQRGRRFRSAKDAEKAEQNALKKGELLPEAERFDSNCITPGTVFMAKLQEQLKYFIVKKVSTDKIWRNCKIILSGHNTPGEGEHKIMDYIRYIRSQDGYDPNTRHCLYGLDADLIMLGLCTHDPHFCLLREEVKFGKKAKRSHVPEEIRFYLLHLSLMREYIELEFSSLKTIDNPKFDIERIIDDWILMGFLVGNDFIPNLPNLHIGHGALPILYKAYMEVFPNLGGYINEQGTLNLERFETFLRKLSEFDVQTFEDIKEDLLYFESKTGRKSMLTKSNSVEEIQNTKPRDPDLNALINATNDLDISSEEEPDTNIDELDFKKFKDDYYKNKLAYKEITPDVMREQAEGYIRAIQWNLNYYYNGVCSWSWYYPHHYSPYISDIKGFSNMKISFDLGKPFKPYEQLLAVLPTASKNFLPNCYHSLMTDDNSIIKDYYPEDFETDLNGKRNDWEAVVLVPFIEEDVLLKTMEPLNSQLTSEESARNQHGPMTIYQYTNQELGIYKAPEYFDSVKNHVTGTYLNIEDIAVPQERLIKGAYPGAVFDVYYAGFPTLKTLKFESRLESAKVKVFETPSREENMILTIMPSNLYFKNPLPVDLLGSRVWVGWPNLTEAKVMAVSNRMEKYVYSENSETGYKIEKQQLFDKELEGIAKQYKERMGVEIGHTDILLHTHILIGKKYNWIKGKLILEKMFSNNYIAHYPLQCVVIDAKVFVEHNDVELNVGDVFPIGTVCFSLTHPHYGSRGTIIENTDLLRSDQLKVQLNVMSEPDLSILYKIQENIENSYLTSYQCACQVSISNLVFSRITGTLFIYTPTREGSLKPVNIGLDLKFNKKNLETPGYTKKINNTWYYTTDTVEIVKTYFEKFPEVFKYISNGTAEDVTVDDIFGENGEEKILVVKDWLKSLPIRSIERRLSGTNVLDDLLVQKLEHIIDNLQESSTEIAMTIKPSLLFKSDIQKGNLAPDSSTNTEIFDRIVNVRDDHCVPLGCKGTVIGIYGSPNSAQDNDDIMYEIMFDKTFNGALELNTSKARCYRLLKTSFINLTHGKRAMEEKTGVAGNLRAIAKDGRFENSFKKKLSNNENVKPFQSSSAFASFNKFGTDKKSNCMDSPTKVAIIGRSNKDNLNLRPELGAFGSKTGNSNGNKISWRKTTNANDNRTPTKQNSMNNFMPAFTSPTQGNNNEQRTSWRQNAASNDHSLPRRQNISTNSIPSTSSFNNSSSSQAMVNTDFLKQILNIPKEAAANNPVSNYATAKLLNFFQSNCMGCPRYLYLEEGKSFSAQIMLPDGRYVRGKPAKSREDASENVAREALNLLTKQTNQNPPPNFPEPPIKWMPTTAKFYQPGFGPQKQQQNAGQDLESNKSENETGMSIRKNKGSAKKLKTNFNEQVQRSVSLQGLKPKSENKTSTDASTGNASTSKHHDNEHSEKPRRTRIAANFKRT